MPTRAPAMTGTQLQATVIDACKVMHLHVAHFRPARTEKGWRTAVEADGKGYPDLTIVGTKVMWREIKRDVEKTTPEQEEWLELLLSAGADAGIWRPADLRSGRIVQELTAIRRMRR